ncbi:MAG TPA: UDP-3-O-(3-hydroxymyristoyl)glucosamine N-acyltransferase [Chitinophagales bacterium]|nr:UDP-3-O-(3-hydroxymyristoyl)glucosamine N-acyltransferase [Chitinophagales bacterium]
MEITAKELAVLLNAKLEGNPNTKVSKLARIEESDKDSFCFLANPKYYHYAQTAQAGILLCDENLTYNTENIAAALRVPDPYAAFQKLMELYAAMSNSNKTNGIDPQSRIGKTSTYGANLYLGAFAYVGDGAKLGNNVKIYPNAYVGDNVEIGDDTIIYANVSVYSDCKVGKRSIVHSGAVIGADGFGFAPQPDGTYKKIPQTGNVVIGNDVEVGANTCIDRAVIGSTLIKDGVKLDNLIQVAHNVELGENTGIAAQAGISGSTKTGRNVMIGGQAGITGHLTIADGVKIQAQAAVIRDVAEKGKGISGAPAIDAREHYRILAAMAKLPELLKRVDALEKQLKDRDV